MNGIAKLSVAAMAIIGEPMKVALTRVLEDIGSEQLEDISPEFQPWWSLDHRNLLDYAATYSFETVSYTHLTLPTTPYV